MSAAALELIPVRREIVALVADIFHHDGPVTAATTQEDIERWDSLQHIALIRALEQEFGVALSMDEMMEIRSVGDIEAVLTRHGA